MAKSGGRTKVAEAAQSRKKENKRRPATMRSEFSVNDSIGFMMRITLRDLRSAVKARLAQDDIPWSVWFYLRVLWEEDALSQRELTVRVGMMQPTTVSALKAMERLGLVTMERVDQDRRRMCVRLTDKARALKTSLLPDLEMLNELALKGFTRQEKNELRRLILKMKQNMEANFSTSGEWCARVPAGTDDE